VNVILSCVAGLLALYALFLLFRPGAVPSPEPETVPGPNPGQNPPPPPLRGVGLGGPWPSVTSGRARATSGPHPSV
jgi:hypothetical protein